MDTSDTPAYYIGYHVQETDAGKIWTRVATAWPSPNDQGGFTVTLLTVPLSGTIVFVPSTGMEKAGGQSHEWYVPGAYPQRACHRCAVFVAPMPPRPHSPLTRL